LRRLGDFSSSNVDFLPFPRKKKTGKHKKSKTPSTRPARGFLGENVQSKIVKKEVKNKEEHIN
jgi:hypothetical protein